MDEKIRVVVDPTDAKKGIDEIGKSFDNLSNKQQKAAASLESALNKVGKAAKVAAETTAKANALKPRTVKLTDTRRTASDGIGGSDGKTLSSGKVVKSFKDLGKAIEDSNRSLDKLGKTASKTLDAVANKATETSKKVEKAATPKTPNTKYNAARRITERSEEEVARAVARDKAATERVMRKARPAVAASTVNEEVAARVQRHVAVGTSRIPLQPIRDTTGSARIVTPQELPIPKDELSKVTAPSTTQRLQKAATDSATKVTKAIEKAAPVAQKQVETATKVVTEAMQKGGLQAAQESSKQAAKKTAAERFAENFVGPPKPANIMAATPAAARKTPADYGIYVPAGKAFASQITDAHLSKFPELQAIRDRYLASEAEAKANASLARRTATSNSRIDVRGSATTRAPRIVAEEDAFISKFSAALKSPAVWRPMREGASQLRMDLGLRQGVYQGSARPQRVAAGGGGGGGFFGGFFGGGGGGGQRPPGGQFPGASGAGGGRGAGGGFQQLLSAMGQTGQGITALGRGFDNFFTSVGGGVRRLESMFFNLKAALLGVGVALYAFKSIGDAITRFQGFISTMTVTTGSMEKSREEFDGLIAVADKLGVSVTDMTRNYAQLSAAAMGTNLATEDVRRGFESMAIASRVLHLTGHDTNLMFYAMTQMVSKGTVSMEELRRQLGEKLPGAMNIAAIALNTTADELEKTIREGKVASDKFFVPFTEAIRMRFVGGIHAASNALDAEINRMTNNFSKIIVKLYDLGVATKMVDVIAQLNRIMSNDAIAKAFAKAIGDVSDKLSNMLSQISPDSVASFADGFGKMITGLGTMLTDLKPIVSWFLDHIKEIFTTIVLIKGVEIGASIGKAIGGARGAVIGGIGGAAVGGMGLNYMFNSMNPQPATSGGLRLSPSDNLDRTLNPLSNAQTIGSDAIEFMDVLKGDKSLKDYFFPKPQINPTDFANRGTQKKIKGSEPLNAYEQIGAYLGIPLDQTNRDRFAYANTDIMSDMLNGKDITNPAVGQQVRAVLEKYLTTGNYGKTLNDVLGGKGKNTGQGTKSNPLQNFIDGLERRFVKEEEGSYESLRTQLEQFKPKYLGKTAKGEPKYAGGSPKDYERALALIDKLEKQGAEYDPLINQLEGLVDTGDRERPQKFVEKLNELINKNPMSPKAAQAADMLSRYQAMYQGKKDVVEAKDRMEKATQDFTITQEQYGHLFDLAKRTDDLNDQLKAMQMLNNESAKYMERMRLESELDAKVIDLRSRATREGREFDEKGFRKQASQQIDEVIRALDRLEEKKRSAEMGMTTSINKYFEELRDYATQTGNLFSSVFKGMEDSLVNFVMTGKISFQELATSFIQQLTRMYVQQQIMMPLVGTSQSPGLLSQGLLRFGRNILGAMGPSPNTYSLAGGGSQIGLQQTSSGLGLSDGGGIGLKYPGRASGGPVNGPTWVGESGRELFFPETPGYVVPNRQSLAIASSKPIEVNVYVDGNGVNTNVSGSASQSDLRALGDSLGNKVREVMLDEQRPGGILNRNN